MHDTLPRQGIGDVRLDPPNQRKVDSESVKCFVSHRRRLLLIEGSALGRRRYCPLIFILESREEVGCTGMRWWT